MGYCRRVQLFGNRRHPLQRPGHLVCTPLDDNGKLSDLWFRLGLRYLIPVAESQESQLLNQAGDRSKPGQDG